MDRWWPEGYLFVIRKLTRCAIEDGINRFMNERIGIRNVVNITDLIDDSLIGSRTVPSSIFRSTDYFLQST